MSDPFRVIEEALRRGQAMTGTDIHPEEWAALASLREELGHLKLAHERAQRAAEERDEVQRIAEECRSKNWLLSEALRDFAERGVRHDLNPTRRVPTPDSFWLTYIDRIDKAVRDRARRALGEGS